MINPIVSWSTDSVDGFIVNFTGNLTADGKLWSGNCYSPAFRWRLGYPLVGVRAAPNTPSGTGYQFNFNGGISGKQLASGMTFGTGGGFGSAFQNLPWGGRTGEIWTFNLNGGALNNWAGNAYLCLTRADDMANFTTWRYSLDITVQRTG